LKNPVPVSGTVIGIAGNTFIDSSKGVDTAKVGMPDGREECASTIIYVAGHELELPGQTRSGIPKIPTPVRNQSLGGLQGGDSDVTVSNYRACRQSFHEIILAHYTTGVCIP
jgi:hypothetical protein